MMHCQSSSTAARRMSQSPCAPCWPPSWQKQNELQCSSTPSTEVMLFQWHTLRYLRNFKSFPAKKKKKKHMTRHSQQLILLSSCCQESWPFKVALFFLAWRCFCKVCQSLRRQRLLHSRSSVQLLSWLHVRGWKWTGLSTLTMSKPWQQLQAAPQ